MIGSVCGVGECELGNVSFGIEFVVVQKSGGFNMYVSIEWNWGRRWTYSVREWIGCPCLAVARAGLAMPPHRARGRPFLEMELWKYGEVVIFHSVFWVRYKLVARNFNCLGRL
jgi:hypothetical protein